MLRAVVTGRWGRTLARTAVVLAVGGLAGCGQAATIKEPSGPRASASPAPAAAVIGRACSAAAKDDVRATDVGFMHSLLLRQEAQLQRLADDLSGAVPGGDLATDSRLAQSNARALVDLVGRSTLCAPFKARLLAATQDLAGADDAVASSAGGGETATALGTAQARFQALKDLSENPPPA